MSMKAIRNFAPTIRVDARDGQTVQLRAVRETICRPRLRAGYAFAQAAPFRQNARFLERMVGVEMVLVDCVWAPMASLVVGGDLWSDIVLASILVAANCAKPDRRRSTRLAHRANVSSMAGRANNAHTSSP